MRNHRMWARYATHSCQITLPVVRSEDHWCGCNILVHWCRGHHSITVLVQRVQHEQTLCEGGVDVVGVVTPLVRGGAQVLHGDQVVELSVLLGVHEREEVGEDGEGQIEVESERSELKERRTCTWMT